MTRHRGQAFVSLGLLGCSWVMMRYSLLTQSLNSPVLAQSEDEIKADIPNNAHDASLAQREPPSFNNSSAPMAKPLLPAFDRGQQEVSRGPSVSRGTVEPAKVLHMSHPVEQDEPVQIRLASIEALSNPRPIERTSLTSKDPTHQVKISNGSAISVSAWVLARAASDRAGLLNNGQIGGAQIGVRAQLKLKNLGTWGDASASLRASSPLSGRGQELALGMAVKTRGPIPVELIAERRFALDRGTGDKWALLAASGVSGLPVTRSIQLDAYGQAGVVGVSTKQMFAGASAELTTELKQGRAHSIRAGVGLWGDAQRGASRLDAGPEITFRLRAGDAPIRISAQWRLRLAGSAEPHSGPALVIGTDF
jgi:hypothetical protein